MTTTLIADHVGDADALFIDQYKDKPRISALLRSYVRQIQKAEDALWDVIVQRSIDVATGGQLDRLGRLVGQSRLGMDDDTYRIAVRTRIRANISIGHPSDIVEVADLALNGGAPTSIGPANFVQVDGGGFILVDGSGYITVGP